MKIRFLKLMEEIHCGVIEQGHQWAEDPNHILANWILVGGMKLTGHSPSGGQINIILVIILCKTLHIIMLVFWIIRIESRGIILCKFI